MAAAHSQTGPIVRSLKTRWTLRGGQVVEFVVLPATGRAGGLATEVHRRAPSSRGPESCFGARTHPLLVAGRATNSTTHPSRSVLKILRRKTRTSRKYEFRMIKQMPGETMVSVVPWPVGSHAHLRSPGCTSGASCPRLVIRVFNGQRSCLARSPRQFGPSSRGCDTPAAAGIAGFGAGHEDSRRGSFAICGGRG